MPAPEQDIIVAPAQSRVQIALEPARSAFHSLVLLAKSEKLSGFADWVGQTNAAMSDDERQRHALVMIGLHYAVDPERSWPSFPAYIDHLAAMSPLALRDKMMDAYLNLPCLDGPASGDGEDEESILASLDTFLTFLRRRFSSEHVFVEIESQAYAYIVDPPAMQKLIVSHLRHMWDTYLAAEWRRVEPMLQDAVRAFSQIDTSEMSLEEAIETITGRSLREDDHWQKMLKEADRLLFVPSAHVGPYLGMFMMGDTYGMVFPARLPEGTLIHAPDLSRAEILVRLGALADDTRLRILKLVADEGEKRSQDIMSQLDLSQSAASRHLKQLSATGYLTERRCEGAKCYSLNGERIEATLKAISAFLLGV